MTIWQTLAQDISLATGETFTIKQQQSEAGGCINQSLKLSDGKRHYFVKLNDVTHGDMFEAEAMALHEMAGSHTVRVPKPVCFGKNDQHCYLVLEYCSMQTAVDLPAFAQQIAAMHQVTQSKFGWCRNNTIGSSRQINTMNDDWLEFWRAHRLAYQLKLAAKNGYKGELQTLGEKLLIECPVLFSNHQMQASMLHGDLWGGNISGLSSGQAIIYDPAFYYGDREVDLAMSYLFGGFDASFYAAYNEAWPLDDGFKVRKVFYNIYHIINHLNLFGSAYHAQAINMIKQVLSEI